ncbi:MAG: hypothetical protein JWM34_644 [Ilumatobacteraceae bacterium]|nr:hypothetical protein [Ilumatobacteraceae bacterium]
MDQVPSPQAPAPPAPSAPAYRADWYPDPTGRYEFRYHNGQIWTGDVSVDGHRFHDSLATPAPAVFAPAVPAGYVGHFAPSSGTGKARAAFVLGLCAFLIGWVPFLVVLAIVAAIVGLVLGIGVLRRDARLRHDGATVLPGHGYAVAGVILAPLALAVSVLGVWLSVVAFREVDRFANVGEYTTNDTSCTAADGLATYRGTITNESGSTRSYVVTVEFLRPNTSTRLHITSTEVDDVASGATADVVVNEPASEDQLGCNVVSVTGPLPFGQS